MLAVTVAADNFSVLMLASCLAMLSSPACLDHPFSGPLGICCKRIACGCLLTQSVLGFLVFGPLLFKGLLQPLGLGPGCKELPAQDAQVVGVLGDDRPLLGRLASLGLESGFGDAQFGLKRGDVLRRRRDLPGLGHQVVLYPLCLAHGELGLQLLGLGSLAINLLLQSIRLLLLRLQQIGMFVHSMFRLNHLVPHRLAFCLQFFLRLRFRHLQSHEFRVHLLGLSLLGRQRLLQSHDICLLGGQRLLKPSVISLLFSPRLSHLLNSGVPALNPGPLFSEFVLQLLDRLGMRLNLGALLFEIAAKVVQAFLQLLGVAFRLPLGFLVASCSRFSVRRLIPVAFGRRFQHRLLRLQLPDPPLEALVLVVLGGRCRRQFADLGSQGVGVIKVLGPQLGAFGQLLLEVLHAALVLFPGLLLLLLQCPDPILEIAVGAPLEQVQQQALVLPRDAFDKVVQVRVAEPSKDDVQVAFKLSLGHPVGPVAYLVHIEASLLEIVDLVSRRLDGVGVPLGSLDHFVHLALDLLGPFHFGVDLLLLSL
ncbi:hypothetical protein PG987_006429 [Apiospora arundinis]